MDFRGGSAAGLHRENRTKLACDLQSGPRGGCQSNFHAGSHRDSKAELQRDLQRDLREDYRGDTDGALAGRAQRRPCPRVPG